MEKKKKTNKVAKEKVFLNDLNFNENFDFLKYYEKSSVINFNRDPPKYPDFWIRIYFKTYSRFESIKLKKQKPKDGLSKLIYKRKSERKFNNYKISLNELDYLLNCARIKNYYQKNIYYESYRTYPSAGARYPLEIYPLILYSKDIKSGLYHYNVLENSIEFMWPVIKKQVMKSLGQKYFLKSSVLFIITAIMKRGLSKYGERYFRFVLLEAGHLAQNLLLLATNINLKSCPIGGFNEKMIMEILDLTIEEMELPIYIIAIGK